MKEPSRIHLNCRCVTICPVLKTKKRMKKTKIKPIKVHHHLELVAKRDQQVMKILVKDKHIELLPESGIGNDGFVFCSERSTETTKRWRGILEMMLALVNEAEKAIEETE